MRGLHTVETYLAWITGFLLGRCPGRTIDPVVLEQDTKPSPGQR
ncbi:hypothetical protein P3102_20885 [Amycolatopsis sp. QT-25]|nr:hypothetical protein [Amycolatopsis sp. QT-25]WET76576.1 hypothetical protein P3102_20885 [Amycolatopsis sp. QT-25]